LRCPVRMDRWAVPVSVLVAWFITMCVAAESGADSVAGRCSCGVRGRWVGVVGPVA
jgi:hypothetical protein